MEKESASLGKSELHGESRAAKARVAAEISLGAVTVIVAHSNVSLSEALEENDAVGSNPGATGGQRSDRLRSLQVRGSAASGIKDNEIVPRPGHFVERLTLGASHHQILPVRLHQRRRQTIQIASRTIFFDILLTPSVRSTKIIGISTSPNPRFQAR